MTLKEIQLRLEEAGRLVEGIEDGWWTVELADASSALIQALKSIEKRADEKGWE